VEQGAAIGVRTKIAGMVSVFPDELVHIAQL
jgi:hypothetical protein